jgi:tetratricopeptide (TPR) repeat protein
MAKYANAPGLIKVDTANIILEKEKPHLKDIPIQEKKIGFDYQEEIKKMSEAAKKGGQNKSESLELSEVEVDISRLSTLDILQPLSPEETCLQRAMALIKKKRYQEALAPLRQLLEHEPLHNEGRYLKALCHFHLKKHMETLETLLPLRQIRLESKLEGRVNTLIEKIRTLKQLELLVKMLVLDPATTIVQLEELSRLDPGFELYYFLRTSILMELNHLEDAYRCVLEGFDNMDGHPTERYLALQKEVEIRLLETLMQPAVSLFKKKNYRSARRSLAKLDESLKNAREYVLFDEYLKNLSPALLGLFGAKNPQEIEMGGTAQERERLWYIIVKKEISGAFNDFHRGAPMSAEEKLQTAVDFFPQYPYVNYLLANCIYNRNTVWLLTGQTSDFETAIWELTRARDMARIGASDPEIPGAKLVAKEINSALAFFKKIDKEIKEQQKEVREVNALIETFVRVMEKSKKGIGSVKQFEEAKRDMETLNRQIKALKKEIKREVNREPLGQLEEAVRRNLDSLSSMEDSVKNAAVVGEHIRKFNVLMSSLESGSFMRKITNLSDLRYEISKLNDFINEMETTKRRLNDAESKKTLTTLITNVKALRDQLSSQIPS